MPIGRKHAFGDGPVFPEPGAGLRAWWGEGKAARAAREAWHCFRRAASISRGCLLGEDAWCINGLGERNRIQLGEGVICRGLLRVETFGNGSIVLGSRVYVGDDCLFSASAGIRIGDDTLIAHGTQIFDNDSHPLGAEERLADYAAVLRGDSRARGAIASAPVTIGRGVWLGFHSIILKGVQIGDGSVVAAGSVVTRDVAPRVVVGGNPAQVLRELPGSSC